MMTVFHGTGRGNLERLLAEGPYLSPRVYLKGRRAFSTTLEFKVAAIFAVRRSPPAALTDERELGVVVEYEVTSKSGWKPARDRGTFDDEHEIAILNPCAIAARAVWALERGEWKRRAI